MCACRGANMRFLALAARYCSALVPATIGVQGRKAILREVQINQLPVHSPYPPWHGRH